MRTSVAASLPTHCAIATILLSLLLPRASQAKEAKARQGKAKQCVWEAMASYSGVTHKQLAPLVHILGIIGIVLVVVWTTYYRGGYALTGGAVFNVSFYAFLPLSSQVFSILCAFSAVVVVVVVSFLQYFPFWVIGCEGTRKRVMITWN